jgi:hypothetical protein
VIGLVTVLQLVAAAIVAGLVGLPLTVLPSPLLGWLAVPAFAIGVGGVYVRSVSLVTASASLALVEYALALVITGAAVDFVTATALGAALFLLLQVVHFAGHVGDAVTGRRVVATHVRSWLGIVVLGAGASVALPVVATSVRLAVAGVSLPLVVIASAGGALLAAGGALWLVTRSSTAS